MQKTVTTVTKTVRSLDTSSFLAVTVHCDYCHKTVTRVTASLGRCVSPELNIWKTVGETYAQIRISFIGNRQKVLGGGRAIQSPAPHLCITVGGTNA